MTVSPRYPFSDLTADQVQALVEIARQERAAAVRALLSAFAHWPGKAQAWPPREREAQVWPPKNVAALSLTTYR